uniref:Uncharacterized protein n=1 Tax=Candidatus Kentrum sp. SD TaxID=2126332 RepID=A0A450Y5W7_9GAMM|nr:MAG: hypothetical protein BECKSD772F_GA0070984_100741 [Candidatus Kentron sp. SD]VFK40574.1 MAG: hypothetical protein BECKSD772E_GA0070983_100740 [Candidatus Kentron sp. SD]VFK80217.1 MAG: hypothetical protein BECKSD772D_GA0070982_10941 [Candidatus Kentron sp. SD]
MRSDTRAIRLDETILLFVHWGGKRTKRLPDKPLAKKRGDPWFIEPGDFLTNFADNALKEHHTGNHRDFGYERIAISWPAWEIEHMAKKKTKPGSSEQHFPGESELGGPSRSTPKRFIERPSRNRNSIALLPLDHHPVISTEGRDPVPLKSHQNKNASSKKSVGRYLAKIAITH